MKEKLPNKGKTFQWNQIVHGTSWYAHHVDVPLQDSMVGLEGTGTLEHWGF
jgi:hypothetical protein